MAFVGPLWILALVALLLLLIWLYFVYFDRPRHAGWSKLPEEHMGILNNKNIAIPTQISHPHADYIKMGYGIVDEEPIKKQYLFSVDEVQQQLNVPIHPAPARPESPIPPPSATLRKAISTDSLDSTTSSLMDTESDLPTVHLILSYHEPTQMLSVQVERVTELCSDLGHVWLLFFLLPHPKPLWRTEAKLTPASVVEYNTIYQQCVNRSDMPRIALLVQLYSSKQQQAAIAGQCRLRMKDINILKEEIPITLSLQPQHREQDNPDIQLGEVLFLMTYSRDIVTVIVSKIRNLAPEYKRVFVRLYVVLPLGKSIKKKTSEREIQDGAAEINETVFFNVPRRKMEKGSLRLSVICGDEEESKSIGHITLNAKSSSKELGHWTRAMEEGGSPSTTMRWHNLRQRRTF